MHVKMVKRELHRISTVPRTLGDVTKFAGVGSEQLVVKTVYALTPAIGNKSSCNGRRAPP